MDEADEQQFISTQPVLPTVLEGVVAYVEVRSGHDNRSRGVKAELRKLGATVLEKISKEVTHVVFCEGMPSTYKKAKRWNCNLVSVSWIEACKTALRVVSADEYPPLGHEKYDDPGLLKNFKKLKSMQPDFDEEEMEKRLLKIQKRRIMIKKRRENLLRKRNQDSEEDSMNNSSSDKSRRKNDAMPLISSKNRKRKTKRDTTEEVDGTLSLVEIATSINTNWNIHSFENEIARKKMCNCPAKPGVTDNSDWASAQESFNSATSVDGASFSSESNESSRSDFLAVLDKLIENHKEKKRMKTNSLMTPPLLQVKTSNTLSYSPLKSTLAIREENDDTPSIRPPLLPLFGDITRKKSSITSASAYLRMRRNALSPFCASNSSSQTSIEDSSVVCDDEFKAPNRSENSSVYIEPHRRTESMIIDDSNNELRICVEESGSSTTHHQNYQDKSNRPAETQCSNSFETSDRDGSKFLFGGTCTVFDSDERSSSPVFHTKKIKLKHRSSKKATSSESSTVTDAENLKVNTQSELKLTAAGNDNKDAMHKKSNKHNSNEDTKLPEFSQVSRSSSRSSSSTVSTANNSFRLRSTTSNVSRNEAKKDLLVKDKISSQNCLSSENMAGASNHERADSISSNSIKSINITLKRNEAFVNSLPARNSPRFAVKKKSDSYDKHCEENSIQVVKFNSKRQCKSKDNDFDKSSSPSTCKSENKELAHSQNDKDIEKRRVIVCTFLTAQEQKVIQRAAMTLGNCVIKEAVTADTTHVVNNGPRRTINMLKGMVRGCWLVHQDWVLDSLNKDKWLSEEKYELKSFGPSVQQCRLRRRALGSSYQHTLFASVGPIFVSPKQSKPSTDELKELIKLSGGLLTSSWRASEIIVGKTFVKKSCVNSTWVLDCITNNKVLSLYNQKYRIENF